MKIRNSLLGIGISLSLILSGMPVSAGQIESYTAYTAEDEDVICFEETADGEAIGNEAAPEGTVVIPDMAETEVLMSDVSQSAAEEKESDAELPTVYAEAGEPTGFAIESVEELVSGQSDEAMAQDENTESKVAKVTVCDAQGTTSATSYATWDEAVTAWTQNANSTLTLLADVTLQNKIEIKKAGMTLDLNGHSLSRNDRIVNVTKNGALTISDSSETNTAANTVSGVIRYTGDSGYCIFSKGTLTIKGGTITSAATGSETICVSEGNLAIAGGTVEQTGETYAVHIGSCTINAEISGGRISGNKSSAIDNEANLKITGGTVESKKKDGVNGISNTGTLEITDGTIEGSQGGIYNSGTLTITGGTINGTAYAIKSVKEGEALITISGNPTVQGAVTFLYRGGKIDLSSIEPAGWTVQHEFGGGQTDYPLQTAYTDNNDNIMILPVECYGLFDENNQKVTQLTKDQKATILIKHDWVYTADGASVHGGCRYKGCEAEQSFTLVQPEAFLYDGTAKTITLKQSGDAAEEIPKIVFCCEGGCIHAGTHTASITVGGVTASLTFAIGKAVPVYQKPAGLKAMEGDTLAQIVLPEGFAWVDPAQRVGEAGTKTFLANYTPADTTNYQSVTGIELSVEVAEAPKKNETESETTAPHVHTFGAWKTTSKATVFAPEVQTRTCSCGAAETQTVGRKLTAVLELPGKLKSLSIRKGDTKTFSLIMANGDSVKSVKSSAAKTVKATLDQKTGKLTLKALKADTAKLTIKLASGESRTYTVKVTNSTIKTTSVSVTSVKKNKLTLAKGKTHKLKTEVKPFTSTQKLTYKSSNKKVAAVTSAGKIKAVAPGKATITVKSGDKSVKIAVTVPGIALAKTSVSVKKGRTLTLSPKLYGISGKVTCTSSNKKIATVTSKGRIKGIKKGTARITVKAGGYTRTVTVKVK